jgi:arylsulfatase A-like enzyme
MRPLLSLPIAALVAALVGPGLRAQEPRPNVLVIVVDDLGYGDLGSFGSTEARTPHLDALAARGLRLTDYYAGGPVCTPSRYALVTGRHAHRAGDPDLLRALRFEDTDSGIRDTVWTLADGLVEAGYETALIGKWHLGHGRRFRGGSNPQYLPSKHGFDSFFGLLAGAIDYNTHWNQDRALDWWSQNTPLHRDTLLYATQVFGDHIVNYLDASAGAGTTSPPFFLLFAPTAPHYGNTVETMAWKRMQLPIGRAGEYLDRFDHLNLPDRNTRKRYLAMMAVLDDEIGEIVEVFERNGLMENTVIWFMSDNGGATEYGGSNGGLRSEKGDPYEGGIRVPSFVVWEGRIPPGTSSQIAGNVDVVPTTLALAGVPLTRPTDGLDLSPHFFGGPAIQRGLAIPNTELGDAVRQGRWKYVRRYEQDQPLTPELYDLEADLSETTDLAAFYPDTVAMLEALLPYSPPRYGAATAEQAVRQLRAFPNPSAGDVTVSLVTAETGPVRVAVYDALGREVAVLMDRVVLERGAYDVTWETAGQPAGVYVVRASTTGALSRRVVLTR